ncbi:hypothetical protein [Actinoplanes subtropicus]|uniref:hypothetical protein n=1 Tax=Actinoplanes subtropicus TaxID=543632 RepID=UPI0012F99320|nr:hypothetical protein [Actinoplanes subtropicus]
MKINWAAVGVGISAVVAIFVIATFVYNVRKNRRDQNKRVGWRLVADQPLLPPDLDATWGLGISQGTNKLSHPRKVQLEFSNIGTADIKADEIDQELSVWVDEGKLLGVSVECRPRGSSVMERLEAAAMKITDTKVVIANRAINIDEMYRFNLLVVETDQAVRRGFHASGCSAKEIRVGYLHRRRTVSMRRLYSDIMISFTLGFGAVVAAFIWLTWF